MNLATAVACINDTFMQHDDTIAQYRQVVLQEYMEGLLESAPDRLAYYIPDDRKDKAPAQRQSLSPNLSTAVYQTPRNTIFAHATVTSRMLPSAPSNESSWEDIELLAEAFAEYTTKLAKFNKRIWRSREYNKIRDEVTNNTVRSWASKYTIEGHDASKGTGTTNWKQEARELLNTNRAGSIIKLQSKVKEDVDENTVCAENLARTHAMLIEYRENKTGYAQRLTAEDKCGLLKTGQTLNVYDPLRYIANLDFSVHHQVNDILMRKIAKCLNVEYAVGNNISQEDILFKEARRYYDAEAVETDIKAQDSKRAYFIFCVIRAFARAMLPCYDEDFWRVALEESTPRGVGLDGAKFFLLLAIMLKQTTGTISTFSYNCADNWINLLIGLNLKPGKDFKAMLNSVQGSASLAAGLVQTNFNTNVFEHCFVAGDDSLAILPPGAAYNFKDMSYLREFKTERKGPKTVKRLCHFLMAGNGVFKSLPRAAHKILTRPYPMSSGACSEQFQAYQNTIREWAPDIVSDGALLANHDCYKNTRHGPMLPVYSQLVGAFVNCDLDEFLQLTQRFEVPDGVV